MEVRSIGRPAVAEQRDGKTHRVSGYAAVFYREGDSGTEYPLFDGAVERINRTAFDEALSRGDDVRGLVNHDANKLLGRTKSGTLRLTVDDVGLRYEIDLPETTVGSDTRELLGRGDLSGSSFAFNVDRHSWERRDDGPDVRTIESVTLFDVGPVTYPAYDSTTAAARANSDSADVRQEWQAWRAGAFRSATAKSKRARAVALDAD